MPELTDVPLFLVQGEKLDPLVIYEEEDGTPVNITGWTAKFQAKRSFADASLAINVSTTPNTQGSITITGAEGKIQIFVKGAHTQTLAPGKYRYNCFLYDPTLEPDDILHGVLTIQDSVIQ